MSHSEDTHLAKFSIEGLSIKGRILSDQSIVTSVLLVNCLLDDMRKGRENQLNRLIERSYANQEAGDSTTFSSTESVAAPKSMIDVTYQQKGNDIFSKYIFYAQYFDAVHCKYNNTFAHFLLHLFSVNGDLIIIS